MVRWTAYEGNSCGVCGGPAEPDEPEHTTAPTFRRTCEACVDVSWLGPADEPCPFCGTTERMETEPPAEP